MASNRKRTKKKDAPSLIIEPHPADYTGVPWATLIQYAGYSRLVVVNTLDRYLTGEVPQEELYGKKDGKGYAFKRSHAIAYAHVIKLQLHLIAGGII